MAALTTSWVCPKCSERIAITFEAQELPDLAGMKVLSLSTDESALVDVAAHVWMHQQEEAPDADHP